MSKETKATAKATATATATEVATAVSVSEATANSNQSWYNKDSYKEKNYSLSRSNPGGVFGTFGHYTGLTAIYEGFYGRKAKDAQGRDIAENEVRPKAMETAFALFMLTLVIAALAPYLGAVFAAIQVGTAGVFAATGVVAPGIASVVGYGMASAITVGVGALAVRASLDAVQVVKDTFVVAPLKAAGRLGKASREVVGVAMNDAGKVYSEHRGFEAKKVRREASKADKDATKLAKENLSHDKPFFSEIASVLQNGKASEANLTALMDGLKLSAGDVGRLSRVESEKLSTALSDLVDSLSASKFTAAAKKMVEIQGDLTSADKSVSSVEVASVEVASAAGVDPTTPVQDALSQALGQYGTTLADGGVRSSADNDNAAFPVAPGTPFVAGTDKSSIEI
ncbi:MAG: hypothetical protein HON23_00385 [Rickettsiales bacterium]|jgi:hypothetical protein|nr:hypothetical protein [Rickettsiales bacterium]